MATKAKRKLAEISFEHEGAHVALTHKDQGFSANGKPYALMFKANKSREFIEKIQQVRVTMELPDFLEKFFGVWGSDAKVLATLMGYKEESDDDKEWNYEDWIKERVDSIELLKSLKESENTSIALAAMEEKDILAVLKAQEQLEPFLKQPEGQSSGKQLEKSMPNPNVEMVEKSALVDLQKSFDDTKVALEKANSDLEATKVELQKANDQLNAFVEKAAQEKLQARKAALKDAVADDAKVETLFKSLSVVDDEVFTATVETLKSLRQDQDKSALFKEQGAGADENTAVSESLVQKALKAELEKQAGKAK